MDKLLHVELNETTVNGIVALLKRCLPILEQDAQMMADITRFSPLDTQSQAIHDTTEFESEKLVPLVKEAIASAQAVQDIRSGMDVELIKQAQEFVENLRHNRKSLALLNQVVHRLSELSFIASATKFSHARELDERTRKIKELHLQVTMADARTRCGDQMLEQLRKDYPPNSLSDADGPIAIARLRARVENTERLYRELRQYIASTNTSNDKLPAPGT